MPLTPQQFRNGVQNLGGQLVPFDQGDLVDRRVYLDEGACGAFSAIWIRNRKWRALGQQPPDAGACMEEVSWIGEQVSRGRAGEVYNEFFAGNGLRQDGMSVWPNGAVDWDRLWFFLSAQQAYYFLGVLGANTGHAIAVETNGGGLQALRPELRHGEVPHRTGDEDVLRCLLAEGLPGPGGTRLHHPVQIGLPAGRGGSFPPRLRASGSRGTRGPLACLYFAS